MITIRAVLEDCLRDNRKRWIELKSCKEPLTNEEKSEMFDLVERMNWIRYTLEKREKDE